METAGGKAEAAGGEAEAADIDKAALRREASRTWSGHYMIAQRGIAGSGAASGSRSTMSATRLATSSPQANPVT
jgi:hypothetical protein